jgi:hydroxypyruvate isomerase
MPRFSINVSMMLEDRPFLERFAAAAELGFAAVDIQFPYHHSAAAVAARTRAAGLEVVLINLPAGDLMAGELGIAGLPGREGEFRAGLDRALAYCRALDCRKVNVLAGRVPAGASRETCREVLAGNLARAAEFFGRQGIAVMVEAINGRDAPGFLVQTTEAALEAIARAGGENLWLQFDLYHRQVMQGDLIPALERHMDQIAHIQFADTPGRHEPGSGEINFDRVFAAIDRLGYQGWTGAEYHAHGDIRDSLAWFQGQRG